MKIYINCCASILVTMILVGCDANDDKSVPLGEQIKNEVLKNDKGTEETTENVIVEVETKEVSTTSKEIVPEASETLKGTVETEDPKVKEEVEVEAAEETSAQSTETSTPQVNESTEKPLADVKSRQEESAASKTNVENGDSGCQVYNPITGGCED